MSVYVKDPANKPQACVIWMHGLGADASDMMGLAEQLRLETTALRHVFIDAPVRPVTLNAGMPMRAWYDILGVKLADREDTQGIAQSASLVRQVMQEQVDQGFSEERIFLAGFSQGGAMALHIALNTKARLAGVVSLSAYLPLIKQTAPQLDNKTPFFLGYGQFDPIVLPEWTKQSGDWLAANGYDELEIHNYPMEHSVAYEEILDLSTWLRRRVEGVL